MEINSIQLSLMIAEIVAKPTNSLVKTLLSVKSALMATNISLKKKTPVLNAHSIMNTMLKVLVVSNVSTEINTMTHKKESANSVMTLNISTMRTLVNAKYAHTRINISHGMLVVAVEVEVVVQTAIPVETLEAIVVTPIPTIIPIPTTTRIPTPTLVTPQIAMANLMVPVLPVQVPTNTTVLMLKAVLTAP